MWAIVDGVKEKVWYLHYVVFRTFLCFSYIHTHTHIMLYSVYFCVFPIYMLLIENHQYFFKDYEKGKINVSWRNNFFIFLFFAYIFILSCLFVMR